MKEFIRKHDDHIHAVLSCFDRMLFRGYLPIMSGCATSGTPRSTPRWTRAASAGCGGARVPTGSHMQGHFSEPALVCIA